MKRIVITFFLLVLLISAHLHLYTESFQSKNQLNERARVNFIFPVGFTQAMALDFQGLVADIQLLEAIFFIGEKIEKNEIMHPADVQYFIQMIDAVSDLDPYFFDPYYFSAALLVWGPGEYQAAINLLEKAMRYRTEDSRIPFQLGFIYFYFLNNYKKGAEYMSIAAAYPGASPVLATLASRLAYYAGDHEFAISFLEKMLSKTRNELIRKHYLKRLEALRGAVFLEQVVARFKKRFQRLPENISELQEAGLLETIPPDPYGGEYILVENGRVFSTSKFTELK